MKRELRYIILAVIIIAVIGILAVLVSDTVLYSLETDTFPSRFHDNVDVLKIKSINSTMDILPLLQELSDSPFPVSLNIRIRNIEEARRYLDYFARNNIRVKNLVVTLDMEDSEIQELSKNAALQRELLDELMRSSISMDMLDDLEIQYRNAVNPDLMMSVRYQRAALLKKIHGIRDQYSKSTDTIIAIDKKTGLDPVKQEKGREEVQKIVQAMDKKYGTPGTPGTIPEIDFPIHRTLQLTFIVRPGAGVYGDTITCFGSLLSSALDRSASVENRPLTLYLDNKILLNGKTDPTGSFSYDLKIDRISAGIHTLYAQSDFTTSEIRKLRVDSVDSVTTLAVDSGLNWTGLNWSQVVCSGTVNTNLPVNGAPVQLVWDKTHRSEAVTDETGSFSSILVLPPGNHTIIAMFEGEGFPINPSVSEPVEVTITRPAPIFGLVPQADDLLAIIIIAVGLLSLFITGAIFYLRRIGVKISLKLPAFPAFKRTGHSLDQPIKLPEVPRELPSAPPPEEKAPPVSAPVTDTSLASRFGQILKDEGLSAAAHMAYHTITGRVAGDLRIRQYQVLTPREVSQSCKGRRYCRTFSSFVALYERIRYGGQQTPAVRVEFEEAMESTRLRVEGEDH